ncbi:flagellar motor switch protein FliN [Glaciibacter psychrotolerans]|uniref:Flagellar motor switch protein FliN/FliY n=1 Tax=Glaciibacter psychrotolerans TaxID=670054 RepID=A0A7Z0J565_9MICO|nr:flagellar motor switch protein FliN [Leifsonia psychrotolerans]NYJ18771.1 flagellar motor switch protein FliN/FliY [Leifsonia psychrotolerans]
MPTTTLHADAAAALAALIPNASVLVAAPRTSGPRLGEEVSQSVQATVVGSQSADLAIALLDTDSLGVALAEGSTAVAVTDILRPALEAAAGTLGHGVLGTARIDNATDLFNDAAAQVYSLSDGANTVGWFAIRLRDNSTSGALVSNEPVAGKLGRINNVEMSLTVEIGRTRMSVREVLGLEPGAVVELDRSAGAPADILLNGRLIAHGEVVVVDQDYAVRVTKIMDVPDSLA